jgi:hypothetical protein
MHSPQLCLNGSLGEQVVWKGVSLRGTGKTCMCLQISDVKDQAKVSPWSLDPFGYHCSLSIGASEQEVN